MKKNPVLIQPAPPPSAPSQPPRALPAVLTGILLMLFVMVFFYKGLLHPAQIIAGPDSHLFYSFKHFWVESLKQGDPAFWCPYLFLGVPFASHPSAGAYSPFNLLFFLFDYPLGFTFQYVLHFWLCAFGTFLFMRRLHCGWGGSLLAALAYSWCSFFVSRTFWGQHAMVWAGAWLPWMLYFLDRSVKENKLWLLGLASASLALCFFDGYPQIMLYSAMTCGFYLLYLALSRGAPFTRVVLAGLGFIAVFLLLAACQFVPTLEFTRLSNRSEWGYGHIMCEYLKPSAFLFFFSPDSQGQLQNGTWHGQWGYFEAVNYVGLAPVVLFLLGVLLMFWTRHYVFFLLLAAVFGVLSMGDSTAFSKAVFRFFFDTVPGFAQQRSIGRMMMITSFAVACGAGLVLNLLTRARSSSNPSRAAWWVPWAMGLVLATTASDLWKFGQRFVVLYNPDYFTEAIQGLFPKELTVPLLADKTYPRFQPSEDKSRNLYYKVSQLFFDDQLAPKEAGYFRNLSYVDTPLADLISMKYVMTTMKLSPERWQEIIPKHYISKKPFPRAILVGSYKLQVSDPGHTFEMMKEGQVDLRSVLLMGQKPDLPGDLEPGIAGEAEITHYSNNRVEIDCEATRPCLLFLADNLLPHWKAWVDGKEAPLYKADLAFRAVPIQAAGKHHVVMRYLPTPLYLSLAVSLAAWIGLVWIVLRGRRLAYFFPSGLIALARAVAGLPPKNEPDSKNL